MSDVIAGAEQVSAGWLTGVLRQRGVLLDGQVLGVAAGEAQQSFASTLWRLEVQYSQDATAGAPSKLFLKCSSPADAPGEFDSRRLEQEILFYQTAAPAMVLSLEGAMVPSLAGSFTIPCYSAAFRPETGASHLLLKDVSETHEPCPTPPGPRHYQQAIDALACLHAFWWDHPWLGKEIGSFPTPEERRQQCADAEKAATDFITSLGDELPRPWREIYERVLPALPGLYRRHAAGKNLTLAHGDAHPGNFLFPKDAGAGEADAWEQAGAGAALLLDWQFWHPTIGGTDLAFLLATTAEIKTRRLFEQGLLRRYYQNLLERGVQGYSWEACWDDYRLSVMLVSIFIPVWQWSLFHWEVNWVALERSMTAFEDLQCSQML